MKGIVKTKQMKVDGIETEQKGENQNWEME